MLAKRLPVAVNFGFDCTGGNRRCDTAFIERLGVLYPCGGPAPSITGDVVPPFCTCSTVQLALGAVCIVTFNDTGLERGSLLSTPEVVVDVNALRDRSSIGYWLVLNNGTMGSSGVSPSRGVLLVSYTACAGGGELSRLRVHEREFVNW